MRQMTNGTLTINVTQLWITRNFWEYFITDRKHNSDIVEALVMGLETELGDVSLKEIAPYTITKTKKLDEVMPASGWRWIK